MKKQIRPTNEEVLALLSKLEAFRTEARKLLKENQEYENALSRVPVWCDVIESWEKKLRAIIEKNDIEKAISLLKEKKVSASSILREE